MKKIAQILLLLFSLYGGHISGQNTFKAIIKTDAADTEFLSGATVHVLGTDIVTNGDSNGIAVLQNIPDGEQIIEFSYLGYFRKKIKLTFPLSKDFPLIEIRLQSQLEEVEDVVVSAMRNYQKAEYLPTQVDVLDEDEVEEESHDKPSDVSHILKEQTGVQVERTSAVEGTLGIRLEGLSSDYVQLLKDGFPLFGGLGEVMGFTQISPLDLQQIEVIKGPSSTLYGGDAIAGVINLVSKQPTESPVYDLLFNGESAFAFDAGVYASQKIKWFAFSLTGSYRYQRQKDWSGYGFTETPLLHRYNVSPQLFFDLSKHAKINLGAGYTYEDRLGGSDQYFAGTADSSNYYYEKNITHHLSTNFKFEYDFSDKGVLTVKSAFNDFTRSLALPFYLFAGTQLASTSEVNYHLPWKKNDLVLGFDFKNDKFIEANDSTFVHRNYSFLTYGLFGQYMYHFDAKTTFEVGLRIDYNNVYKIFPLPYIAALRHWNEFFSTRINIGMGYKLPSIFQDASEEARFIGVQPIADSIKPEWSLGGTIDWKVKLPNFNGVHVNIYQLYFLTYILRPLIADTFSTPNCPDGNCITTYYQNGDGYTESAGVETGIEVNYRGFSSSVKYTLTDSHNNFDGVLSINPLTSKHIVSMLAGYSIKSFFLGIDCYYYSPVKLSDGSLGRSIWEIGLSAQYSYKFLLLFANLENIANIRQTSFGPIVFPDPTYSHPQFAEIYGPLEGRLFNAGIKIHLGYFYKKRSGT